MEGLQITNNIEGMIYEIRGKQVMLDRDLAVLYQIEPRVLNQKVKRNIERFPDSFCFQLTKDEYLNLKSQFVISSLANKKSYGGDRYLPYAFTEQGTAMLSAIIKSDVAVKISIQIMEAFVSMRKYISKNFIEQKNISTMLINHDNRITLLEETFAKLEEKKVVNEIYFKGQIYDAYSKIIDILQEANKELIIIDAYADKTTLDIIRELKANVTLIINDRSKITKLDIEKYNEQYHNLKIVHDNTFHDRYFILDKKIVYHCGTSINDAGSKTFSINRITDELVIKFLIIQMEKLYDK